VFALPVLRATILAEQVDEQLKTPKILAAVEHFISNASNDLSIPYSQAFPTPIPEDADDAQQQLNDRLAYITIQLTNGLEALGQQKSLDKKRQREAEAEFLAEFSTARPGRTAKKMEFPERSREIPAFSLGPLEKETDLEKFNRALVLIRRLKYITSPVKWKQLSTKKAWEDVKLVGEASRPA
jgi:hypothetical protein